MFVKAQHIPIGIYDGMIRVGCLEEPFSIKELKDWIHNFNDRVADEEIISFYNKEREGIEGKSHYFEWCEPLF